MSADPDRHGLIPATETTVPFALINKQLGNLVYLFNSSNIPFGYESVGDGFRITLEGASEESETWVTLEFDSAGQFVKVVSWP